MSAWARVGPSVPAVVIAWGAILFLVLFAWVAFSRLTYPYELEWMGGAMVDHLCRVIDGQPVYCAPTAEYVPFLYTPLQYWLSALLAVTVTGEGFLPMRLVSLVATCVAMVLVFSFVRRRTGRSLAAAAALLVFAGGYFVAGTWYDTTRADALCVCLSLIGLTVLERGGGLRSAVVAGLVMVLAYFAKQTAFGLAVAFAVATVFASPRRAGAFLLAFAGAWLAATFLMDGATDGWFSFYTWTMPRRHGLMRHPLVTFWWFDLRALWPSLAAIAWLFVVRLRERPRGPVLRDLAWGGGWLGVALLSRMHDGGAVNVLMPAIVGVALLVGLALGEAVRRSDKLARGVPWLLVVQVALLAFDFGDAESRHAPRLIDPSRFVPTADDRDVGDRVVELLRRAPGDVIVPRHGYLSRLAGKRPGAHEMAVIDLRRSGDESLATAVLGAMLQRATAPDLSLILVDEHVDAQAWPGFVRGEPLVPPSSPVFEPVLGPPTRPVVPLRRRP